jgi:hypothetical protein
MIKSVSDGSAFQIGHQYLMENRVRIVDADEAQITSAVIGNSGLYEQTIRLKDGHLISKCSCTLPEEPLCRHCIAVLLEYHRWAQPRQRKPTEPREAKTELRPAPATPQTDFAGSEKSSSSSSGAPDVKLSDVMQMVEWLQPAMKAIETGDRMPQAPQIGTGEVSAWIHTIRNLEERRREGEAIQEKLESEMKDREACVVRLTEQLQSSIGEAKAAQAAVQDLHREVASVKGMLSKVGELTGDIAQCEGQMRSVAHEMLSNGSQLDKLAGSWKEIAEALGSMTKHISSP